MGGRPSAPERCRGLEEAEDPLRGDRARLKIHVRLESEADPGSGVVLHTPTHAGHLDARLDAGLLKLLLVPDPAEQQAVAR